MKPGLYDMVRTTDQTGVSGTGRVAQMAVFEDGSAVVRWMTGKDSTVCWAKYQDALDVHINLHPDTTKLIPANSELCEHGIDNLMDYCDDCETTAVVAQGVIDKGAQDSERWAALRQESKRLSDSVYDYCASRQLRCEEHNGHGLYFDVWIAGQRLMFDCSPEDQASPYPGGLVVVRNSTHGYNNPTRIGAVNMLSAEGPALMDDLLGVAPV